MSEATYDRPVRATLHVHLDNGETFEASAEDLARFNLVDRTAAYGAFRLAYTQAVNDAGGHNPGGGNALDPVASLVAEAIAYPEVSESTIETLVRQIADIERTLRTRAQEGPREGCF